MVGGAIGVGVVVRAIAGPDVYKQPRVEITRLSPIGIMIGIASPGAVAVGPTAVVARAVMVTLFGDRQSAEAR